MLTVHLCLHLLGGMLPNFEPDHGLPGPSRLPLISRSLVSGARALSLTPNIAETGPDLSLGPLRTLTDGHRDLGAGPPSLRDSRSSPGSRMLPQLRAPLLA